MKKYRTAIVGLGRMASTIDDEVRDSLSDWIPYSIASACKEIEAIDLIAGADILPEKLEAFKERWGVEALYEDYLEMIEKEKPDLVAICTKGELHAEMGTRVAEAGVPMIFLEKAIACSMKEADMLLKACKDNNTLLNTGVLRRFNRNYRKARQLIENGEIGNIRSIAHFAPTNLLHGHIHSVDTIMYLLGDPKAKSVWGEILPRDTKIENNRYDKDPSAIYQIEFENGVEAWTINAGNWDFEVWGSAGSIKATDNGVGWVIRKPSSDKKRVYDEVPFPESEGPSATTYCLLDLIEAHNQGRQPIGNIDVTHHATEICLAIAESHIQGKRVNLPINNRDLYIWHV